METKTASSTAHSRTGAVKVVDMMLPRTMASAEENTAAPMMPRMPPNRERITDSTRNCRMMSRRRAPRALRTPISRMRSVTDTSMMFITTTPPTIRLIPVTTTVTT